MSVGCRSPHPLPKVDLGEGEGLEVRVGLPNRILDVLFKELVHEDAKEWPGLKKNLRKFRRHLLDIMAAQSCLKNFITANVFPVISQQKNVVWTNICVKNLSHS